jgi:hypothetical protein
MRTLAARCVAGLSVSVVLIAAHTHAAVVFTSATRTISATANNNPGGAGGGGVSDTSSALGTYSNSVEQQVQTINEQPGVFQTAYASQQSFIGGGLVSLSGTVTGVDNATFSGSGHAVGTSSLIAEFSLDSSEAWSYTGQYANSGFGNQTIFFFSLFNTGTSSYVVTPNDASNPHSGVLSPGSYRVFVQFNKGHAGTGISGGTTDYSAQFVIPAPAAIPALALGGLLGARRRR